MCAHTCTEKEAAEGGEQREITPLGHLCKGDTQYYLKYSGFEKDWLSCQEHLLSNQMT